MALITDTYASEILRNIGISEADEEILAQIKNKAAAVIGFMNAGGAKLDAENLSEYELTVISIGVNDLLNNTSGGTGYSPAFKMMAMQLCSSGGGNG